MSKSSQAKHKLSLHVVQNGQWTVLGTDDYNILDTPNLKIKANGSSIKVWYGGSLVFDETNSAISAGGVAFGADDATFDNLKIGYDTECDQGGSAKAELTRHPAPDRAPQVPR